MREFNTTVQEALVNGLKPGEHIKDAMFFEDLYNLVPDERALEPYQDIQDIFDFPSTIDRKEMYPFPQWFELEEDNFVVLPDGLYKVDDSYMPVDLEYMTVDNWSGGEFSESFRCIDYGENWILFNRHECIYKRDGEIYYTDLLQFSTALKHNNRTILGGSTNGVWTDRFLRRLKRIAPTGRIADLMDTNLGTNFVLWSAFDSRDFPFGLIHPDEVDIKQMLYSNQFGFMEMPFSGAVLEILEMSDQVLVFGEDGVAQLTISQQASGATYGLINSQNIGIKKRGAAGGDDESCVFIDNHSQLWKASRQGLKLLDFSEYMKELSGTIYVTKDPDEELFYIGDEENSYVLRGRKLTRVYQTVSHASGAYEHRAGVALETGDKKARFRTQSIDLGITARKTLTGVAIATDGVPKGNARATATVHDRRVESPWVMLNPEGYAATRIHGKNHKIEAEINTFKDLNIDNIELKWQIDDNRQTRGIFATQDASGAG